MYPYPFHTMTLSYPIISWPIISWPIISCPIISYLILSYPTPESKNTFLSWPYTCSFYPFLTIPILYLLPSPTLPYPSYLPYLSYPPISYTHTCPPSIHTDIRNHYFVYCLYNSMQPPVPYLLTPLTLHPSLIHISLPLPLPFPLSIPTPVPYNISLPFS